MFRSLDEFKGEWKQEAALTQRVLEALTDESLGQEVAPGFTNLGKLAAHVTGAVHFLLSLTGLNFSTAVKADQPSSAKSIAEAYRHDSTAMLEAVDSQWTDASLAEVRNFFGHDMPIHAFLRFVIQHQAHHRGQMTILMRQAGLKVPGIYGPSREEWEAMQAAKN
ncbi:DinB family protein [Paenibacillus aurantius]|uniref:DinB family protein n=1 Tax=Paenibacillus aurantius TaxID=2918900 RepID=A0AA96RG91_9BACL|nr:DinB family protein [Paenibacillus aurantius]WNQ12281.1 DinB family protein [Paenibacillus aurantius]